jgi:hypothetical protein
MRIVSLIDDNWLFFEGIDGKRHVGGGLITLTLRGHSGEFRNGNCDLNARALVRS